MLRPFSFSGTPEIHFGAGSISLLPERISRYGSTVLLVLGEQSFQQSSNWEKLQESFGKNSIRHFIVNVSDEPSPGLVDDAVTRFRKEGVDVVVSIGGGAVMDAGKAISAMLTKEESVVSYLEGVGEKEHDGVKLPFIALPTTSGTGSEATKNAVICERGDAGYKRSLRHDNFIPDIAIVDPELTITCPAHITASSGLDAFSQLLESFTSTKSNIFTDSLALEAIRCVSRSLVKAFKDGSDPEARSDMAYAAMISGITLANAGLGLIHGLAGVIGGLYDIPHGTICGTLFGVINRLNIEKLIKQGKDSVYMKKYAGVGKLFSADVNKSDEFYALSLADMLDELVTLLQIPRLGDFKSGDIEIDKVMAGSGQKNNPVNLSEDEIRNALKNRI